MTDRQAATEAAGSPADPDSIHPSGPDATDAPGGTSGGPGIGGRRLARVVAPGVAAVTVLALIGLTNNDAWMDEACSLAATEQFREVFHRTSGTMAAYYAALNGWILVSDSLWWLRLLSVLLAAGAVVLTGVVAVRVRGTAVAQWACLLLGVSWMMVRYAREVRSFAMVLVVVTAAWWALDHIVEGRPGSRRWTIFHLALSASIPLVHGLAVIPLFAQGLALLVARAPVRVWVRVVPGFLVALGVVGWLYRMGASEVGVGGRLSLDTAEYVLLRLHGGTGWDGVRWVDPRHVLMAASVAGLVVAIGRWARAGTPLARFRAAAPAVWAVATIGGLFALSVVRPQMVDRYAIAAIPALAMLQADAAIQVQRAIVRRVGAPARWATAPVVPLLLAGLLLVGLIPLQQRHDRTWSEMVDLLAAEAEPGDGILVPRNSGRMMLDYAWSQHDGPLPELEPIGPTHPLGRVQRYGSRVELPESFEMAADMERLWVVQVPVGPSDEDFDTAMFSPGLAWRFDVAEVHTMGSGSLVLLVRKP